MRAIGTPPRRLIGDRKGRGTSDGAVKVTVTTETGTAHPESGPRRLRTLVASGWILLVPGIALYGLVLMYPLVGLVIRSFSDDAGFTVANYAHIFTTPLFRQVLISSFTTAGIVTALCLLLGYPVAYLLYLARPGWRKLLLTLLVVPLLTSVLVRSFAWIALLEERGPVNSVLGAAGMTDGPIPLLYNETGLLIGMVNVMLPYFALPLFSVMTGIDRAVMPAAGSLGAAPVRAFWTVFFPLSVPGVAAGALLTFVLSLGFYITPALLGGPKQTMIAQLIETQVKNLAAFEAASALAIVLMALTIVLLAVYNKFFGIDRLFGGTH